MNKTLKKIIIIATVSVVVYFGMVIPFDYLNWYSATLNYEFYPSDYIVYSCLIITPLCLLLSLFFVFIKRVRGWLYYLIPISLVSGLLADKHTFMTPIDVYGNYFCRSGVLYSCWGAKVLDLEGPLLLEYRSNNDYDNFYLVNFDLDFDNDAWTAKVYNKNVKCVLVMEANSKNIPYDRSLYALKEKVAETLDCYIVEE